MKKLTTLICAAGLVFCAAGTASAIDFKAKGQWLMSFDYGQNGNFQGGHGQTGYNGKEDEFNAEQRVRLQLSAVASESLQGVVYFEIGNQNWGRASQGGALGADGTVVEVRYAYIDWAVPESPVKVRMGLQEIALPSYTMGKSQIFTDDMAALSVSCRLTDEVSVTAFWARAYNDNYAGDASGRSANFMDNADAFALVVPMSFNGVKIAPYGLFAAIGPNTLRRTNSNYGNYSSLGASRDQFIRGLLPAWGWAGAKSPSTASISEYATAWWAGLTADITVCDPFRIAFDVMGGAVQWEESRLNRVGWMATGLLEYRMDWGIPGILGWYSSGDDDDPGNGSERMPFLDAAGSNNQFSNYAFDGIVGIARESTIGISMAGTWGIGLRLRDMSFVENLKHTFRFNVIGGTNSDELVRKARLSSGSATAGYANAGSGYGVESLYMTEHDTAVEVGLETTWQMYRNFMVVMNADYISLNQQGNSRVVNGELRDAWNISCHFRYDF